MLPTRACAALRSEDIEVAALAFRRGQGRPAAGRGLLDIYTRRTDDSSRIPHALADDDDADGATAARTPA